MENNYNNILQQVNIMPPRNQEIGRISRLFRQNNPGWRGGATKKFKDFNKRLLKEGRTKIVAYTDGNNNELIYDKITGRTLQKKLYYTQKGKLRARYNRNKVVKKKTEDTILFVDKYVNNIKEDIKEAETSNRAVNIPVNMTNLNDNLEYLLEVLKPKKRQYLLKSDEKIFTLNTNSMNRLVDYMNEDFNLQMKDYDSAREILNSIAERENFTLEIRPLPAPQNNPRIDGLFFPYYNLLNEIDLSRYGVYRDNDEKENYDLTCLLYALKQAKININGIKYLVKNGEIPQVLLPQICDILKINIHIHRVEANKVIRKYGKYKKIIDIGLIEGHYFLIEKTKYTSYSIENYFDIKNKKDFHKIIGKNNKGFFKRTSNRYIDSYKLIQILVKNKDRFLKEITYNRKLYQSEYYKKVKEYNNLDYNATIYDKKDNKTGNLKENTPMNTNGINDRKGDYCDTYFFDFETTTRKNDIEKSTGTYHKPYCVYTHLHPNGFFGLHCGKKLLIDLCNTYGGKYKWTKNNGKFKMEMINDDEPYVDLIAHNSNYDFRFLQQYLTNIETIEKDNGLIQGQGEFCYNGKKIKIYIKDSLKMINMRLQKFGKTFNLPIKKEIMPYDLYTEERVEIKYIDIDECLSFIEKEEKEEYLTNCKEWDCIIDNKIDILKYAGKYCYMDCCVLEQGYNKFNELVGEAIGLDITNYLTLASMADDYLKIKGCYNDVFQISGIPRAFIQECVIGGRTMIRNNTPSKELNCKINDFDAVSLYPSAMRRMPGFLKGIPKIIGSNHKNRFENKDKWDSYFIYIEITKLGKKRQFPLQSIKDDKSIRNFTNDLVGKKIYIDKIALEDLIEYQDVEYEFIRGYYFDEGFNDKVKIVIEEIFNERIKYKKQGNPLQLVFKELMNSSYGKSMLKPIDKEVDYVKNKDLDKYINRNFNYIKVCDKLACLSDIQKQNQMWKITKYSTIDTHFNNVHIGASILSWSKRIMNEVMCLSEDLGIHMYYTDTDSIHIDDESVELLATKFKEKYGRDLIGKGMGQFHTDFDLDGAVDKIVAINSIFLGKKCYIDELQSKDKDGNIIKDFHIRMKGIPDDCIKHKAKKLNVSLLDIYNFLYENKNGLDFDLLAVKPKFEMCKNMTIISRSEFNRNIKFNCGKNLIDMKA